MIKKNEDSKLFFDTLVDSFQELEEQDAFVSVGNFRGYESVDFDKLVGLLKGCSKYDNEKYCNITNGEFRLQVIDRLENAIKGTRKLVGRSLSKDLFSDEVAYKQELQKIDVARYLMGKGYVDQLAEVLDNMDQHYAIYITGENPSNEEIGDLIRFNGHNCGEECDSSEEIAKLWIEKGFVQMPPYEYPLVDHINHVVINVMKVRESFIGEKKN